MNSLTTTTMKHFIALAMLLGLSLTAFAEDIRLQPLKDLNGYFPFTPPRSLPEWEQRKEYVRRPILVAARALADADEDAAQRGHPQLACGC